MVSGFSAAFVEMAASGLLEGLFVAAANLNAKCEAACSLLGRGRCLVVGIPLLLVRQKRYGCSSDSVLLV